MLECKQRNSDEVVFSKPGTTDPTGEYTIYVDQDRADEVCDVKLVSSPQHSCSEKVFGRDKARVILTRYNGITSNDRFANTMLYMAEEVASGCAAVLKQMQELDEEN